MINTSSTDLSVIFDNWSKDVRTEVDKALARAIRRTAVQIKENTKANAIAGIKSYNNHVSTEDNYEEGNILDAIRMTGMIDRYDEDERYIKVHVMGVRSKRNKTFRFRFLEKGTKERSYTTKAGNVHRLGSIKPARYFGRAKASVDPLPIFEEEMNKAINKINSK